MKTVKTIQLCGHCPLLELCQKTNKNVTNDSIPCEHFKGKRIRKSNGHKAVIIKDDTTKCGTCIFLNHCKITYPKSKIRPNSKACNDYKDYITIPYHPFDMFHCSDCKTVKTCQSMSKKHRVGGIVLTNYTIACPKFKIPKK